MTWQSFNFLEGRLGAKVRRRHIIYGALFLTLIIGSAIYLANLSPYRPANQASPVEYIRATVLSVRQAGSGSQTVKARIMDGPGKNQVVNISRTYVLGDSNSQRLPVGSRILLTRTPSNGNQYLYLDRYRIPGAVTILLILAVLAVIIGLWRGLTSVLGLAISIAILAEVVLPRIIAGHSAFTTCIEGAFIIAIPTIYVAHGFTKRTTIALISTLITLSLVLGITAAATYAGGISGNPGDAINTDQEISLIQYAPHHIDLGGLLMGGVVIASLGALEDITTAQAAAVDEIYKARPKISAKKLYSRGLSVGREHVAALINTLVLLYFGAALPTIVLTALYAGGPLVVMFNNETIMEAVVRSGVVSIALLLAVPISTGLASYYLPRWYADKQKLLRS